MSLAAVHWAITLSGITPAQKLTLIVLADHHNGETQQCNPSLKRLSKLTGQARATVSRNLKTLSEKGFIEIVPMFDHLALGAQRSPNQYYLKMSTPSSGVRLPPVSSGYQGGSHSETVNREVEPEVRTSIRESGQKRPDPQVEEVFKNYLGIRSAHFEDKLGRPPKGSPPALTPERRKLIRAAITRHGIERVKKAVCGLFLDDWMVGNNPQGKEYTNIERALVIKKRDGVPVDQVDRFAELYMEKHHEF